MKESDLLYPGKLHGGIHLRRELMKAINACERVANATGGATATSPSIQLRAFLENAMNLAGSVKSHASGPQLVRIYCYTEQKTSIVFEYDRTLDPRFVPASGMVFTPSKVLAGATVVGNKLIIAVTVNVAAGFSVAYTDPGATAHRDTSGNKAPNFTGVVGTII